MLGPRLAYLRQYSPQILAEYRLVTILSRSDEEFSRLCDRQPEEYLVYKVRTGGGGMGGWEGGAGSRRCG